MATLNELVNAAMKESSGGWDDAVEILRKKLRGSKRLFDDVVWPIILISLRYQVRSHDHLDRMSFWNAISAVGGDGVSGESDMSQARRTALLESTMSTIGSIYNYPLQGGKKLGDARRSDMQVEISWHDSMAKANGVRADWFKMIVARLPDEKTAVRMALTETEIMEMGKAAQGGEKIKKPRSAKQKGGRRAEMTA